MSELMSTKTEIGRENVYYEMEYKGEDDAETYEKVIVKNESPQERLRERAQPYKDSGEVKSRYFLVAVTAIAVASFLTAAATMVLAFAKPIPEVMFRQLETPLRLFAVSKNSY